VTNALDVGQTLEQRIAARLASMSRAERQVAEYLRTHAQEAVFANAERIAAAAGVSDATVVRTARKLGYASLLELKYLVGQEVIHATTPADRLRAKVERAGEPGSLAARVFAEAHERLAETERQLSEVDVEAAVDLLARAGNVLCYGLGPSESNAQYLALRLRRLGRTAVSTGRTGFRLADDLLPLGPGDAVVLFSPARLLRELDVIVEHCRTVGAHVVLLTDSLGAVLGDRVDVTLRAVHSPSGFTGEALSALVIADVLALGLATRTGSHPAETSELLTTLRSRLTATDTRNYIPHPHRP
jgi:DNA-binding MurR/RpiR family transcriptional regulator